MKERNAGQKNPITESLAKIDAKFPAKDKAPPKPSAVDYTKENPLFDETSTSLTGFENNDTEPLKDTAVTDPKPVELSSQILASSIAVNEDTVLEAVAPPKRVFVGRLKGTISTDIIKAHLTKRIADVKRKVFGWRKLTSILTKFHHL